MPKGSLAFFLLFLLYECSSHLGNIYDVAFWKDCGFCFSILQMKCNSIFLIKRSSPVLNKNVMFWWLFWSGLLLLKRNELLRFPIGVLETDLVAHKALTHPFDSRVFLLWNHQCFFFLQLQHTIRVLVILEKCISGMSYVKITWLFQKLSMHSVQFIRSPCPSSLLTSSLKW